MPLKSTPLGNANNWAANQASIIIVTQSIVPKESSKSFRYSHSFEWPPRWPFQRQLRSITHIIPTPALNSHLP